MRGSIRRGLFAVLAVTAVLPTGPAVRAEEDPKNEVGFLLGTALGDTDVLGNHNGPLGNGVLGLRYGHLFTPSLGLSVDATSVDYVGGLAFGDVDEMGGRAAVDWIFARTENTRWFLSGGVGAANFNPDSGPSETRGLGSLEFGQKIFTRDRTANFRWSIRADQTFTGSEFGDEDLLNVKGLLGGSWGLGVKPADDDGDGVVNHKDKCPDTPRGATVDSHGCPEDTDGDGVLDGIDRCPDTPKGWPVDARGCPLDSDGDGVPDGKDRCPDTPRGATVDTSGCPKDTDGDGVFDGLDRCPDTPRGTKVDSSGCPLPEERPKAPPLFTPEKKTLVLEGVNFETDSAKLTPESLAILDRVAASLRDWPDVRVEVGGHTDSVGTDAYNMTLSGQRANSVVTYLQSQGVAAERMRAKGYGETKPIDDNKTAAGRAKNRRVELSQ